MLNKETMSSIVFDDALVLSNNVQVKLSVKFCDINVEQIGNSIQNKNYAQNRFTFHIYNCLSIDKVNLRKHH